MGKKTLMAVRLLVIILMITGCSGGGSNNEEISNYKPLTDYGTALLGNLAEAEVKIYEVNSDGTQNLLWEETTSSGEILEEIGNFNMHVNELEDGKVYLYRVIGGCDWDVNDDGIKDDTCTQNKGIIRAISLGKDFKEIKGNFKVSLISEIIYERVAKYVKYGFSNSEEFRNILNQSINNLITDIDGDGEITIKDILIFNPVGDRDKLTKYYRQLYFRFVETIHSGKNVYEEYINLGIDTPGISYDVEIVDNTAYVADGDSGLQIINISDINNPRIVSNIDTTGYAMDIEIVGDTAYVANGSSGLWIIDISDINNPQMISSINTPDNAQDVEIVGNIAYIADSNEGLRIRIINISDINNPQVVSNVNIPGYTMDVEVVGDTAYVANVSRRDSGLYIIDISDINNPRIVSNINTLRETYDVEIAGDTAYVANWHSGLQIIDISDINNPRIVSNINTLGKVYSVKIVGNIAYLVGSDLGLYVVDLELLK